MGTVKNSKFDPNLQFLDPQGQHDAPVNAKSTAHAGSLSHGTFLMDWSRGVDKRANVPKLVECQKAEFKLFDLAAEETRCTDLGEIWRGRAHR